MTTEMNREAVPEPSNPIGFDGIEFIEFATSKPQALGGTLEMMGFRPIARHRSREVEFYRQGSMNVIVNAQPADVPRTVQPVERPVISAFAVRVRDADYAFRRALDLGAWEIPVRAGAMELNIPAIHGVGESLIYFVDRYDEFSIYDITVQTFPVPHDAVDPMGFVFHAGSGSLGFITDLGYVTKLIVERLRQVQTLVIETNHDEKLLQNDTHRPWPVKQRIQSRHGHLSNTAAAGVIEELLPGKIERVVLGHLSRDCNTPDLAVETVRASLAKCGKLDMEIHCATQFEVSPRFRIGETDAGPFQPTFENAFFQSAL